MPSSLLAFFYFRWFGTVIEKLHADDSRTDVTVSASSFETSRFGPAKASNEGTSTFNINTIPQHYFLLSPAPIEKMEEGKTLSKNLVYTPLEAYYNVGVTPGVNDEASQKKNKNKSSKETTAATTTRVDHPADYMKQKSVVPISVNEPSFVSFTNFISQDYHRNRVTSHQPKNNGSRPLSLQDMEERIRQRAVTIFPNPNSSIPISSTNTLKKQYEILKSKKRRQRSWEKVKSILITTKSSCDEEEQKQPTNSIDVDFLKKLNSTWNQYIWKLLNLQFMEVDNVDVIKRKVSSLMK